MDKLHVPLAALADAPVAIDVTVTSEELGADDACELRAGLVRVTGTLRRVSHEYVFRGTVSGTFKRACDRCLFEVDLPFVAEALWTFAAGPPDDEAEADPDPDIVVVEGTAINLAPMAWEEVVLAYPGKFVACEDRPDLCPECAATPEQRACLAKPCDLADPRNRSGLSDKGLAGLADMFPDVGTLDSED